MKKREVSFAIDYVEFPNMAVGTLDGKIHKVKKGLPGQVVKARTYRRKKGDIICKMIEVEKQADYEIPSFCEHFGECGGCSYQTIPYDRQLEHKSTMVKALLVQAGVDEEAFEGILASPKQLNYRNKMEYSFGDLEIGGEMTLGMHRKGAHHDVVTVEHCHLTHSDFNKIMMFSLEHLRKYPKFNKKAHEGFLRHLLVRRGENTGEILIGLSTTSQITPDLTDYVEGVLSLELEGKIVGICQLVNDGVADVVRAEPMNILYGNDYYHEKLGGLLFKVSIFSFFQTNTKGAELLYETALGMLPDINGKVVFDLFSGTGTIGQFMAQKASEVYGIELIEEAVEAANENAKINKLDNCKFIAGDVFVKIDELKMKPDTMVVDPPRVGIGEKALKKICAYKVPQMVYVSCNPKTMAQDLAIMKEYGYVVEKAIAVDQFPHTEHVETICKLSRKQ